MAAARWSLQRVSQDRCSAEWRGSLPGAITIFQPQLPDGRFELGPQRHRFMEVFQVIRFEYMRCKASPVKPVHRPV